MENPLRASRLRRGPGGAPARDRRRECRGPDGRESLAFILGLLVLASAGANAQKSIGFATLTDKIGSTRLRVVVVVVPSLFVVLQQVEATLRKAAHHVTSARQTPQESI